MSINSEEKVRRCNIKTDGVYSNLCAIHC